MFFPVLFFPRVFSPVRVASVLLVKDGRVYLATAENSGKYPLNWIGRSIWKALECFSTTGTTVNNCSPLPGADCPGIQAQGPALRAMATVQVTLRQTKILFASAQHN